MNEKVTSCTADVTGESVVEALMKIKPLIDARINHFIEDVFLGIPIVIGNYLAERVWEFPQDRFIEYGPEDLWWAIKHGFGKWVYKPVAYKIGGSILMNQEMLSLIKADPKFLVKFSV